MRRQIASRTPVGYEQVLLKGNNWLGSSPTEVHMLANGVFSNGMFTVPLDPVAPTVGGLFVFNHSYPLEVIEILTDMDAGMAWLLNLVRNGSSLEDEIVTGGGGKARLTKIADKLPILNPGDSLKFTSINASGVSDSRILVFVKYPENCLA